jgi:hypothetical protein
MPFAFWVMTITCGVAIMNGVWFFRRIADTLLMTVAKRPDEKVKGNE